MNASAAARPDDDDGRLNQSLSAMPPRQPPDSRAVARAREWQEWQEESQELEKRKEEEDERRWMRQCKISTLEGMLGTHEKRLVRMELWQVELDKLARQGGPQQTEDSWNWGTRDERRKRAEKMAEDHRGDVKQEKDFIWSVIWDLQGLKKEAREDAIDDVMHEATAYHSMHTIVEVYQ